MGAGRNPWSPRGVSGSNSRQAEDDVRDEVDFYLEMRTGELIEAGLSPDRARAEAERAFGDRALHEARAARYARRRIRRARWEGAMDEVVRELRHGARGLLRRPGFTATAVLTLALGIGGASTMFTVIERVLLEPLPYPAPERLVRVFEANARSSTRSWAPANYLDARAGVHGFSQLAAYRSTAWNLLGEGEPERLPAANVSANFFDAFGVAPALGPGFDDRVPVPGDERTVILSHDLWTRRFGSDPEVIGRQIQLDSERASVAGVMPRGFDYPPGAALWMKALRDVPEFGTNFSGDHTQVRSAWYFSVVGRLRPEASLGSVRSELDAVAARIREADPESNAEASFNVIPLHEQTVASARSTLWMLFGAVGIVLLIACTNVTNLVLVRSVARRRELAVRAALGAGTARIIRQVVWETALIGVLGGTAGLALASLSVRLLRAAPVLPRSGEIEIDGAVWGFVAVLTVLSVVAVGLLPGLVSSRLAPGDALGSRDSGTSRSAGRLGSALVVAEVTLAVVLVLGAGLVLRSLGRMAQVDLGIRTAGLATFSYALPGARDMEPEEWRDVHGRMLARVREIPGVEAAGLSSASPLSAGWFAGLRVQGRTYDSNDPPNAGWQAITPDALRAAGIPLLSGRFFDASDQTGAEGVAIVNRTLATRMFPDQDPIGQAINTGLDGTSTYVRIVGVVGDTRNQGPADPPAMAYYRPFAQDGAFSGDRVVLTVRAAGDPTALVRPVQQAVWSVDRDAPFFSILLEDEVGRAFGSPLRFVLSLLGAFALVALLLGCVGIYGVMAYTVRRRIPEFGVRLALGARVGQVAGLVLRRGLVLGAMGVAIGSVAGLVLTRFLEGILFGVSRNDPATFLGVAVALLAACCVATLAPAWRAGRVAPATAMRSD